MNSLVVILGFYILFPRVCSSLTIANVAINFSNNGTHTKFNLALSFGHSSSFGDMWLGVGLNQYPQMVID